MDIQLALQNFVADYVTLHETKQQPMLIQYDSNWPSPCYQSKAEQDEWVAWKPMPQLQAPSLNDFEQALDISMDKQLAAYFTSIYSDNLNATTPRGDLQLLLPWNQQDFEQLQQNLIAHVLMKRRLEQDDTLFFAVTDEDDFILSVHNATGKVMLEQVGLEPKEVLANSLLEFIQQLTPRL